MIKLNPSQKLMLCYAFQVEIIAVHQDEGAVEFMYVDTQERHLLPIKKFREMIYTLH